MTVVVLVYIICRHRLSPSSSSFKVDVVDVNARVNDIGSDTFTTVAIVGVLSEVLERDLLAV